MLVSSVQQSDSYIYSFSKSFQLIFFSIMVYQRIEYSSLCHGSTSLFIHSLHLVVVVLVAELCLTLATPWTVARQAPLSLGFPMKEYWSGLPFLSPGDLPNTEIKPRSPVLQADSLPAEPPGKCLYVYTYVYIKHCGLKFEIEITHMTKTFIRNDSYTNFLL